MSEEQTTIDDTPFGAIVADLKAGLGDDVVVETSTDMCDSWVVVDAARLHDVMTHLRDSKNTNLDMLSLVTGVDYVKEGVIECVYHLDSVSNNTPFVVKVKLNRDDARVSSIVDLYKTADWHEREVYDLSGITFEGHPNLTRILCADDWVGHPLRKDYAWPESYHGIPCGPFAGDDKNIPPGWELEGFTTRNSG